MGENSIKISKEYYLLENFTFNITRNVLESTYV